MALTFAAIFTFYARVSVRKFFFVTGTLFILMLFLSLFFLKPNSSLGRLHIYSVELKILSKSKFAGIGLGKFKKAFNEYQADYFSKNSIDDNRSLLADNTFYAFNDYIQWVIETGVAGLIAILLATYFLIKRVRLINKQKDGKTIVFAASSSLLCIAVASLFSYPLQVIPIQAMALFSAGILIFYPVKNTCGKISNIINLSAKIIFSLLTIFFVISSARTLQRKVAVKNAFELTRAGYKKQAVKDYEAIIKKHPKHGDIIYLYAEQLYYANRLPEALSTINKAKRYYVNNKVYKLKAKIEDELGLKNEAEASYLRAIYMVPNRMASRFDLLNFYLSQKDTLKAIYWANSILNMPVKVPSERTEIMLNETGEIFQKIKK